MIIVVVGCNYEILGNWRTREMEERRQINRVEYSANSVIVDRDTQEKYYGQVKNISPLGIAITVKGDTPKLLGKDVIVVAETMIMYADVIREDEMEDGSRVIAFSSRRFTDEVLQYLFDRVGLKEEDL
jgi:hypothetical protein